MRQPDDPNFLTNLLQAMGDDPKFAAEVHAEIEQGRFDWILTTPQLAIRDNILQHPESLTLASRRLGKSFAALVVALEMLCKSKTIVRVFSSTQRNCEDIVNDNMSVLEQLCPPDFIRRVRSNFRWFVGPYDSELRIHSMDSQQALDNSRGGKADMVIIEEIAFVPKELLTYALDSVIKPMFLRSPQQRIAFITTAARDPKHWVHSTLQPRCEANDSLYRATIYDNPHVTPERAAEFKASTLEDAWAREYLCEPHVDETLVVIPEFKETLHVAARGMPAHKKALTVIDFGGVQDKTGVVLGYYDVKAEHYYVRQALLFDKFTTTADIMRDVTQAERDTFGTELRNRCADGPGQLMVDLRQDGFHCWLPKKPNGSWAAGILEVRNLFKRGQLMVHPDCQALIDTLLGAQYNARRTDFERTEEYGHADLIAALMYFVRHASTANCYPELFNRDPQKQYVRPRKKSSKDLRAKLLG